MAPDLAGYATSLGFLACGIASLEPSRRGEALALFLDEEPTYAFLPPVYYYQGRVREAMNTAGFVDSYRAYLNIRGKSTEDPLLPDVRRRAGAAQ